MINSRIRNSFIVGLKQILKEYQPYAPGLVGNPENANGFRIYDWSNIIHAFLSEDSCLAS
jgi:hypothetical protein